MQQSPAALCFSSADGYPENSSTWVSSGALIARLNFALDLTNGRLYDVEIKRDNVFKNVSLEDHNAMLGRLIETTLHGEISASTRKVVDEQLKPDAASMRPTRLSMRPKRERCCWVRPNFNADNFA